jgi:chemotaxis response regulator CheB
MPRRVLADSVDEFMIRLLLVEDDLLLRQGLRMWLERVAHIVVIGEASTEGEALVLAQTFHPDVVLLDMSMHTTAGITATMALRAVVPHSAVVLISLHDDVSMRAQALAAGAVRFIGKQEGARAFWQGYSKPEDRVECPTRHLTKGWPGDTDKRGGQAQICLDLDASCSEST